MGEVANIAFTSHQEEFLHFQCQKIVLPTWLKFLAMEQIRWFLSKNLPYQSDSIRKLLTVFISGQIIGLDGRMLVWIDWLQLDMATARSTQWTNMNLWQCETERHEKYFTTWPTKNLTIQSLIGQQIWDLFLICATNSKNFSTATANIWAWKTQPNWNLNWWIKTFPAGHIHKSHKRWDDAVTVHLSCAMLVSC